MPDQRHRALGVDLEVIRNSVIEDPTVKAIQAELSKLASVATNRVVEISPDRLEIKPVDDWHTTSLKEALRDTQDRLLGGLQVPFDRFGAHTLDAMSYGFASRMLGDTVVSWDLMNLAQVGEEDKDMRWDDLKQALEFLPETHMGIVLQVQSAADIAYVRRWVINKLGQPARQYGDVMHFDNGKMVRIASIQTHDFREYREHQLFFIGRERDTETGMRDIVPVDTEDQGIGYVYWRECGLCLADLAVLLGTYANAKLSYYGYLDDNAPVV
jgi:hypothetical protein